MTETILIIIAVTLLLLLLGDYLLAHRGRQRLHTTDAPAQRRRRRPLQAEPVRLQPPKAPDASGEALFLILDLQTTGLSVETGREDRILQTAWLLLDPLYRELDEGLLLVDQTDAGSPEAQQVHHLREESIHRRGVTEAELLERLVPALERAEVLVCHHVRFDASILLGTLRRVRPGAEPLLLGKRAFCTMELGAFLETEEGRYPSLITLTEELTGISGETVRRVEPVARRNVLLTRLCLEELRRRHPSETLPGSLPTVGEFLASRSPMT